MRAATVAIAILALSISVAGCKRKDPNTIDAEAFDAITTAVQDQMNAPGDAIYEALRTANEKPQVGWDTLTIPTTTGTDPEPVNWWLQAKGWISLSGAQFASRPVFTLTDAAKALLADPDQDWFTVKAGEDAPDVDCSSPEAMAVKGCAVTMTVTPELTDAGKAVLGGKTVPPIKVHAVVYSGADGWQIPTLNTDDEALDELALDTILGPKASRGLALKTSGDDVANRIQSLATAQAQANAPPPPPPAEEIAPVRAVPLPTDAKGSLGLGLPNAAK